MGGVIVHHILPDGHSGILVMPSISDRFRPASAAMCPASASCPAVPPWSAWPLGVKLDQRARAMDNDQVGAAQRGLLERVRQCGVGVEGVAVNGARLT